MGSQIMIMGLTSREKAELAAYQLKDIAQVWYEQWKDSRLVRAVSKEWMTFKSCFLDRFFSRELRQANFGEFIKLNQGKLSVKDYALKINRFSKYSQSLVANPREFMNRFMTGCPNQYKNSVVWRCLQMILIHLDYWCLNNKYNSPSFRRREKELGLNMKGLMDKVVPRIDKSLPNMDTLTLLGMIRLLRTHNQLALGVEKI